MTSNDKYSVSVWHGEGRTLWYLMREDTRTVDDWEVLASYRSREAAFSALLEKEKA